MCMHSIIVGSEMDLLMINLCSAQLVCYLEVYSRIGLHTMKVYNRLKCCFCTLNLKNSDCALSVFPFPNQANRY